MANLYLIIQASEASYVPGQAANPVHTPIKYEIQDGFSTAQAEPLPIAH